MSRVTCFFRVTRAGPLRVRFGRSSDSDAAWALLYNAVQTGAASQYTQRERDAWAPSPTPPDTWQRTFLTGTCLVATNMVGRMQGFMTLGEDAYLDLAYVAPRQMGKGVAGFLYERIEIAARNQGFAQLSTEASHLAKPFFQRQGWQVTARQDVIRNGVALTNFRMSKTL